MVNPVTSNVTQATLNPFQKRIEDQIKNPGNRETEQSQTAANRADDDRGDRQQVAQQSASARNDNGDRQEQRSQQRGSVLDVTV